MSRLQIHTSFLDLHYFWCVLYTQTQAACLLHATASSLFKTWNSSFPDFSRPCSGACLVPVTQRVSAGLDSEFLWFCGLEKKSVAAAGGRELLVCDQSVVWVGGVWVAVGERSLPQHMACNCGLVDSEKWGSVLVFRWSCWWALVKERKSLSFTLALNEQKFLFVKKLKLHFNKVCSI